jgi:hypothetical protein
VAAGSWIASAILLIQAIIYGLYLSMLSVKIIEGLLRLAFRIPFSRSRHAVDSGLIGVLSLLGLFGRRHRKKTRTPRYKLAHTTTQGTVTSQDVPAKSSYETPSIATPPRGPPSVLKVEQIGTPYREEADDETGHILGAWPPFSEMTEPAQAGPSQPKSGFTRVRGGRANYDSPYAIMAAVVEANEGQDQGPRPVSPSYFRQQGGLPRGAMSPASASAHVRQKSEIGVVGDFTALQISRRPKNQVRTPLTPETRYLEDEDEDEDEEDEFPPKRSRRWFGRRAASSSEPKRTPWSFIRGRTRSDSDDSSTPASQSEAFRDTTAGPSRSFVVVRNKLPGTNRPSSE